MCIVQVFHKKYRFQKVERLGLFLDSIFARNIYKIFTWHKTTTAQLHPSEILKADTTIQQYTKTNVPDQYIINHEKLIHAHFSYSNRQAVAQSFVFIQYVYHRGNSPVTFVFEPNLCLYVLLKSNSNLVSLILVQVCLADLYNHSLFFIIH